MRYLLVTNVAPYPAKTGAHHRTNFLYRAIRRLGHTDLAIVSNREFCEAEQQVLRTDYSLSAIVRPCPLHTKSVFAPVASVHAPLAEILAENLSNREILYTEFPEVSEMLLRQIRICTYDAIVVRYLRTAVQSGLFRLARCPVLVDVDDLDTDILETRRVARGTGLVEKLVLAQHVRKTRRIIANLLPQLGEYWLSGAQNRDDPLLSKAVWLPNVAEPSYVCTTNVWNKRLSILFVGSFHWTPNLRAVEFFLKEVWPKLHKLFPDVEFRIVGPYASPRFRRRCTSAPGVEFLGYVEDLGHIYRDTLFTIAPIVMGGGTSVKVIESLAHSRACISSVFGARGLAPELTQDNGITIAGCADDWLDKCQKFIRDPQSAVDAGKRGACIVLNKYSRFHFERIVHETVTRAVESRKAGNTQ